MEHHERQSAGARVQETNFESLGGTATPPALPVFSPGASGHNQAPTDDTANGGGIRIANGNGTSSSYGSFPPRDDGTPKPTSSPLPTSTRAIAPDLLRGILMMLMAMDHNVMALRAWEHGTAGPGEGDSALVDRWNYPIAYIIRTASHLCAPGFMFLLGMGIEYFGRSRRALGWRPTRMLKHFAVRAVVLTAISAGLGFALTGGQIWFLNMVLWALAVDYFLVGLVWLLLEPSERALAMLVSPLLPVSDDDATAPLLSDDRQPTPSLEYDTPKPSRRALSVAWHAHNVLLFALALVSLFWNKWLSVTNGHCDPSNPDGNMSTSIWDSLFRVVQSQRFYSGFPPLAWLSPALLGLLHARIITSQSWSLRTQVIGTSLAATFFTSIFVLTRVFRIGNLSEDCLYMPEHLANPAGNPYLQSIQSFFYVVKYPPDAAFFAYTMAANYILLALFTAIPAAFLRKYLFVPLAYGTSALFFYIVHLVLLMLLGTMLVVIWGRPGGTTNPITKEPQRGVWNMWLYWLNWSVVMAMMYPLCRWYGAFKRTKGADSVWRFF